MLNLRPYQQAAIDGLYAYWSEKRGNHPLIVAPTGAGKSLIIAHLIKDACEYPGTRIMVLSHVKELLEQNAAELMGLYPQADVGFFSASIGQKRLDKQITFAGIQSVWERAFDFIPPPDLVLIDEAHMLPKNVNTRYGKFIADLMVANPMTKIVGLTATPYRLDSGKLHEGEGAIFDGIAYDIGMIDLIKGGYLAPVISKAVVHSIDLTNVRKRNGEFDDSELAEAASDPELVRFTIDEIVRYGAERKAWLIFACGINHANMLANQLKTHDVPSAVVTGEDDMKERTAKIDDFKAGRIRALINVNVLTTGFNVRHVDLVAMVRATGSPGLYVQAVGRGMRTAEGKRNCLLLDYGQNVERHGLLDQVTPPKGKGDGEPLFKLCPNKDCKTHNPISAVVCIECGTPFPLPEGMPPIPPGNTDAYKGAVTSDQVQSVWADVDHVSYSRHRKEGKPDSIKVSYLCGFIKVNEWLCPDHGGYAADRYEKRMPSLGATALTTDDALIECQDWIQPSRIKLRPNGKYHDIMQLDYKPGARISERAAPATPGWRPSHDDDIIPF
jgi:DNA repair protein RadD